MGLSKLKIDLCLKLLPTGERFYPPGLMLHQRPYIICKKDSFGDDKPYFASIQSLMDMMTSAVEMAEGSERSNESDSDESEEEEGDGGSEAGMAMGGGGDDDPGFGNMGEA